MLSPMRIQGRDHFLHACQLECYKKEKEETRLVYSRWSEVHSDASSCNGFPFWVFSDPMSDISMQVSAQSCTILAF